MDKKSLECSNNVLLEDEKVNVRVKVHYIPNSIIANGGPNNYEKLKVEAKLSKLLDNTKELDYVYDKDNYLDDVFIKALEDCSIAPVYSSLFGLRLTSNGGYPSLSSQFGSLLNKVGKLNFELRVRFAFLSECTVRDKTQYCYRYSSQNDSTKLIMNETVLSYYFNQRRRDFIDGKFTQSNPVTNKTDISPELGVAVLDMVRIAHEMDWTLSKVQKKVNFKKLLPINIKQSIKTESFFYKKRVRLQFKHYIKHFKTIFTEFLQEHSTLFVYTKYLRNLELVPGCEHNENFDIIHECKDIQLLINGDKGIFSINSKNTVNIDFHEIADMDICKNSDDVNGLNNTFCISITLLKGGMKCFYFEEELKAESFATCIDGYYRLLVDSHYCLNEKLTPPHVQNLVKLSCHGPISFEFAEKILKEERLLRVGDCLLRQSSQKYDEYYINTVLSTDSDIEVKNYKLDRDEKGLLGIYGEDSSHEYKTVEALIKSCLSGVHDPIPFRAQNIIPPRVKEKTNLIIRRSSEDQSLNEADDHKNIAVRLLPIKEYNIISYLGRGRFTEVKLYRSKTEGNKLVVIKETMYREALNSYQASIDFCMKQCVDDSFERSRNLLSKVDTSHIVKFIGTIRNMMVLQHVAIGSITNYLRIRQQKKFNINEEFGEKWFLTVLWQLAHACTYLEEHDFCHGNIKGSNVLLMKSHPHPHIKLADPGVTICSRQESLSRFKDNKYEACLRPPWLAYEFCAVTGKPHINVSSLNYPTITADRWSFATTVYEICNMGKSIEWNSNFTAEMTHKYTTCNIMSKPQILYDEKFDYLHELLKKCWSVFSPKRPPFRVVLRHLRSLITQIGGASEVDDSLNEKQAAELLHPFKLDLDTYYEDNLTFRKKLGKGHFGHVDLFEYVQSKEETVLVAVKSLNNHTQWSGNEIETMRSLDHDFVVRLKGITSPSELIVLEYLPEGSLFEWIKQQKRRQQSGTRYPLLRNLKTDFIKFCEQIAEGMVYLQDAKILHRDLALRNILLAKDDVTHQLHIKISDFGLSRLLPENEYYYKGNPEQFPVLWYAPECLTDNKKVYKKESDIWSYGVLLWEMFSYCESPCYPGIRNTPIQLHEFYYKLKEGLRLKQPADCSDNVYELMTKCWNFEPEKRVPFRTLQTKFHELRSFV